MNHKEKVEALIVKIELLKKENKELKKELSGLYLEASYNIGNEQ